MTEDEVVKMVNSYAKENSLEIGIGNYHDSIRNNVRGVQRYIDEFFKHIPDIYPAILEQKGEYYDLVAFLFMENENIIKHKALSFMIESYKLLNRKWESLRKYVEKNDDDIYYMIPRDAFRFIYNKKEYNEWVSSAYNIYTRPENEEDQEEVMHVMEYLDERLEEFPKTIHDGELLKFTKKELLVRLDNMYLTLTHCINHLKELSEISFSAYSSLKTVRGMVNVLVMTYCAASTIKEIRDGEEDELLTSGNIEVIPNNSMIEKMVNEIK